MAGLFQGDPLPSVIKTTQTQQTAPEFYTNYLQDVANLGQNAVQQGGIAGFSPLQQQAFQMAPDMAFAGSQTLGNAAGLAGAAGTTAAPDIIQGYMNPYQNAVVNEMSRLAGRNLQENVLPNLEAASVGTGNFGSRRAQQIQANTLRDIQADLLGRQAGVLNTGYQNAMTSAQADLNRQLQSGQALGNIGTQQQTAGTTGLKTLSDYGAQQQALGQKQLDYPMTQAQNFAKLMQGYQMPMGTTQQYTGVGDAGNYSLSPLAQIAGLGSLFASLFGNAPTPQTTVALKKDGGSVGYADGGQVLAYHDEQGRVYDTNGHLIG